MEDEIQTLHYDTVIVGSGIAGRTVAAYLPEGSYIILERGEDRSHGEVIQRYLRERAQGTRLVEAEAVAFQSDLPWNEFERLSTYNYSRYAMVRGGASNWWGGKATRFTDECFASRRGLPWAISAEEMAPWYERAERRLNVSGDPLLGEAPPVGAIEGAAHWRTAFTPYFAPSRVNNVALNKTTVDMSPTGQGRCIGRSHCAICKEDAKGRPDNLFAEANVMCRSFVVDIEFDGDRAVAVQVFDGRQLFRVAFKHLVIAANGIETPRLLARSELPAGVRKDSLGRFYQDHAHLEIDCRIPKAIPYGALGGLTHVQIDELSRVWDSPVGEIETSAYALTHEPGHSAWIAAADPRVLERGGEAAMREHLKGCFRIYVELETTAEIDIRVDLEAEVAKIHDEDYAKLIPEYDRILGDMLSELHSRGVEVLGVHPHYRRGYGGHHFCGTTNWSDSEASMMDNDLRLIGTENVYIAGSSVIPKAGGLGPTLTLAALSERLGAHLASIVGDGGESVEGEALQQAA